MKRLIAIIRQFKFDVLAGCVILLVAGTATGQGIEDPTNWKYEVKKISAHEYRLVFHLELKSPWHIYSLKPGGDGYEMAPSYTFDKNDKVKLKGKVAEKGKMVSAAIPGIDGKVNYYSGTVDYVQDVVVTGPVKVTGKQQYQVCNDKMCLPPKDKDFVFEIKP